MNSPFPQTAIESLKDLESYYQSRYEYYLAKATEASEYKEHVKLLIVDLKYTLYLEHQTVVENQQVAPQLFQDKGKQLSGSREDEIEKLVDEENKDRNEPSSLPKIKELIEGLSQAMEAIKLTCELDSGKSLHKSYLHKKLNHQLSQELSVEMVDLYLDEAVNRGLIERDRFDKQCYIAVMNNQNNQISTNDLAQRNGHSGEQQKQQKTQGRKRRSQKKRTKYRNLPFSARLKLTLQETVRHYIADLSPERFSAEDVINYLYSTEQQEKWTHNNVRKIKVSIFNVLSRKEYLDKYWKRVEPGTYIPL